MPHILIVDDTVTAPSPLEALLGVPGHDLVHAAGVAAACAHVTATAPELVVIDATAGVAVDAAAELTRRIKDAHAGTLLPVVVVAAADDRATRDRGLAAGADDIVTASIDRRELALRVDNLLALRRRDVDVTRRDIALLELAGGRDEGLAAVVHDLRSLITVILGAVDYVDRDAGLSDDARDAVGDCRQASGRMMKLLASIHDLGRPTVGKRSAGRVAVAVAALVDVALAPRRAAFARRDVDVTCEVGAAHVEVNRDVVERALGYALDNCLWHVPTGGRLRVWTTAVGADVELRVGRTGAPATAAERAALEAPRAVGAAIDPHDAGLGLYACRLAAEVHGGKLWVEDDAELPAVLACRLPAPLGPVAPTRGRIEGGT